MRKRVEGFTRVGGAIVNTDDAQLQLIKQKREQKRARDQLSGEIDNLRSLVMSLTLRVEELERRV